MNSVLAIAAVALGAGLGAYLARRNERASNTDRLLAEALNDVMAAIADVASGQGGPAQARYASAVSRIALHASPGVVSAFRAFQDDATTYTAEGRTRLVEALQFARADLGHKSAAPDDLHMLLFGGTEQGSHPSVALEQTLGLPASSASSARSARPAGGSGP